jgi:radical SAM superfamily enzyme YgiQ (UPF0313 family)
MRVLLADVKSARGFVSKDTVVGGYGSRLEPFSQVTRVIASLKQLFHDVPSVHLGYIASILRRAGHEVFYTRDREVDADVALVLSSLVDHRGETSFADRMRSRGIKVGFIGLTASKMPELFQDHSDFIFSGEPESGAMMLAAGQIPSGVVHCDPIADLDALAFPARDLFVEEHRRRFGVQWSARPRGGAFALLASRGCPEFCTYCPHRILASYRQRSIPNIVDELAELTDRYPRPYVIFRDPLFSQDRDRCLALCDEIQARGLEITFEAETRLDRLDESLIDRLQAAGLRVISFGVESSSEGILKKAARRNIPEIHQRRIIEHCQRRRIVTAAFYVFGFLQDSWESIAATIDHATTLGSTFAQFKILTPYPGTPMFRQLEPLLTTRDWERFDGYTPTFKHPNLTDRELRFLLGAAYTRFYMRPSYLANFLRVQNRVVRNWTRRLDGQVSARHAREEQAIFARTVVDCRS